MATLASASFPWDTLRSGNFQYKGDGEFGGWLVSTVKWCILDLLRRSGREPFQLQTGGEGEQQFEFAEDERSQGSMLAHKERSAGVHVVLNRLPPILRDVIVLRTEGCPSPRSWSGSA